MSTSFILTVKHSHKAVVDFQFGDLEDYNTAKKMLAYLDGREVDNLQPAKPYMTKEEHKEWEETWAL